MKRRTLGTLVGLVVAAVVMAPLREAHADEPTSEAGACDAAFEIAELRLRPVETRLLDARAALRVCALPSCKPWMVDDCSKRFVEVEGRIPSVVFSAEDARGTPLYDVRIVEDDRELLSRLNGRAVEMDPGQHELVAERGGARLPLSVVIVEGKKAQQVVFSFPDDAPLVTEPKAESPAATPPLVHPWARPLAGGLLAGGVVAMGVGITLAAVAIGKKNDARCDEVAKVCDQGPLDSARAAARGSTVGFVVGGALAVGAVVTFLVFGRTRVRAAVSLDFVHLSTSW